MPYHVVFVKRMSKVIIINFIAILDFSMVSILAPERIGYFIVSGYWVVENTGSFGLHMTA